MRGKARAGLLKTEKTFQQTADQFLKEYAVITEGQRSSRWVEGYRIRLRLHLLPFFGELGVSEVTAGKVQEYRVHRATTPPIGGKQPVRMTKGDTPAYKPPSRSTLHDEIVTLRQVLKTAIRHGWLQHLRDLSPPYRTQGKIVHRPWFSDVEYTPAPAPEIRYPEPTDKLFPGNPIKMFNNRLTRSKLKLDRDGNPRTLYSLRHTYICLPPHGGGGHLPDCQELPHLGRDDRKILRRPHQERS